MSNERHLKETIQRQADTIKELEADYNDEFVKGQMKTAEIGILRDQLKTLQNIQNYLEDRLKDNEEFQQVIRDLEGGNEC
jgi:Tfp pilus assembly protein PilO